MEERRTYESKDAIYNLNPENIFDVVADLDRYISCAKYQAQKDNHLEFLTPSVQLMGRGKRLVVSAEAVDQPGFLSSFNLAELNYDGDNLTLSTNAHPRVVIPSNDLEFIANKYIMK